MKSTYLFLIFSFLLVSLSAQDSTKTTKPSIKLFTRNYGDSIALRWAPDHPDIWELGNESGYFVLKMPLDKDGKQEYYQPQIINEQPIKPYEQARWEQMMETNKQAEIAAIALFGEGTANSMLPPGMVGSYYASVEKNGRMAYALMAADMDLEVAKAEGLYFVDKNIDSTKAYLYTVMLIDSTTEIDYDFGSDLVDASLQKTIPKVENVQVKCNEHKAYISWQSDYPQVAFSTFDVYRSKEWDKGYEKANTSKILNAHSVEDPHQDRLTFVDSLPELLTSYYYVVVGHTLFDDFGEYTTPVEAFSIPQLKAAAALNYTQIIDSTMVQLTWKYPEEHIQDVAGFVVKRSDDDNGEYTNISGTLSNNEFEFLDEDPFYNSYYSVAAFNPYGDTINSMIRFAQILDLDFPEAPTGLDGTIDSNGVVTLTWNPNTEDDLLGYRIYSGNYTHEEFSRVTPGHVSDTVFIDSVSIKTLTKNVYYSILAIDKRYNPSPFTEPLKIRRPDIIPPSSPLIVSYKAAEDGVKITFVKSSSSDVKYHEVWRQPVEGEVLEMIYRGQEEGIEMTITDTSAKEGHAYKYQIVAIDDSDLRSEPAGPVTLKRTKSYEKAPITETKALANNRKRMIKLGWEYNEYGVKYFLLYRAVAENQMTVYQNIPGESREFYDKNLKPETLYQYRLRAVFEDGSQSPFSEVIVENID